MQRSSSLPKKADVAAGSRAVQPGAGHQRHLHQGTVVVMGVMFGVGVGVVCLEPVGFLV